MGDHDALTYLGPVPSAGDIAWRRERTLEPPDHGRRRRRPGRGDVPLVRHLPDAARRRPRSTSTRSAVSPCCRPIGAAACCRAGWTRSWPGRRGRAVRERPGRVRGGHLRQVRLRTGQLVVRVDDRRAPGTLARPTPPWLVARSGWSAARSGSRSPPPCTSGSPGATPARSAASRTCSAGSAASSRTCRTRTRAAGSCCTATRRAPSTARPCSPSATARAGTTAPRSRSATCSQSTTSSRRTIVGFLGEMDFITCGRGRRPARVVVRAVGAGRHQGGLVRPRPRRAPGAAARRRGRAVGPRRTPCRVRWCSRSRTPPGQAAGDYRLVAADDGTATCVRAEGEQVDVRSAWRRSGSLWLGSTTPSPLALRRRDASAPTRHDALARLHAVMAWPAPAHVLTHF